MVVLITYEFVPFLNILSASSMGNWQEREKAEKTWLLS